MKKILSILLSFTILFAVMSQEPSPANVTPTTPTNQEGELVNKKGMPILPQSGDIAVGASILPNIFYNGGGAFPQFSYDFINKSSNLPTNIYGKYFLQDNMAARIHLGTSSSKTVSKYFVADDAKRLDPLYPDAVLEDKSTIISQYWSLGLGAEFRRGETRLQALYGAEVLVALSNYSEKYEYANQYTAQNLIPSEGLPNVTLNALDNSRTKEVKSGKVLTYGLSLFGGVEYFIIPKISLGGEMSLNVGMRSQGEERTTVEFFDGNATIERPYYNAPGDISSSKYMGVSLQPAGLIYMMFHF